MIKKIIFCGISIMLSSFMSAQVNWEQIPYKFSSHIWDFEVFEGNLIIAGNFFRVNGQTTASTAIYNGTTLTTKPNSNQGGGGFQSLTTHNGSLFGGGDATISNGFSTSSAMVLEWDGSRWSGSKYMLYGNVWQVISYHDTLFTTTTWTTAEKSNFPFDYVGMFVNNEWVTAGSKSLDKIPNLFIFEDELYAYGSFTTYGTDELKNLAKWTNGDWVQVGDGTTSLTKPVTFKGELYAFRISNNDFYEKTYQLIQFNGTDWTDVPNQTIVSGPNSLRAITADENYIYVAGDLTKAGGETIYNSARFDGNSWNKIGDALDTVLVNTLEIYNGYLYAGTMIEGGAFGNAYVYKVKVSDILALENDQVSENYFFDFKNKMLHNSSIASKVSIINTNGVLLKETEIESSGTLDLSSLETGSYILLINADSKIVRKKIVII